MNSKKEKMSFLFSGFMYDHLKTFKPVFYLAAGPMIFGAFLLLFATLCKSNQTSLGRQDVTSLVSSPKHRNGLHSSYRRCSCPPKILLTAPGDRESLIIVERLTVIWFSELRISVFITPILKSLVVPVIWLALIDAIYSRIAPFVALSRIFFPANEVATLKTKQPIRFQVFLK